MRTYLILATMVLSLFNFSSAQAQQNTTSHYGYDYNGNLTKITDPLGHVSEQVHDPLNNLIQQIQPAPVTGSARPNIGYGYDGIGRLTTMVDPLNFTTSYDVDGLGNQNSLASPDTGNTVKTYDDVGNLKTSTDARGKLTTYTYDALNRVINIKYASGIATVFEYDGGSSGAPNAKGRITKITDESGQTVFSYDAFSRLVTKIQAVGIGSTAKNFTTTYVYGNSGSSLGKITGIVYPSGNRIDATYDNAGRIDNLTLNYNRRNANNSTIPVSLALLKNISYAPFGLPISWTWGNANTNTYNRSIDLDGRITSYPLGNPSTGGMQRTVLYDADSRILNVTHTGTGTGSNTATNFNQSFTYDNLDRVIRYVGVDTIQSFEYDANGNRKQFKIGGTSYTNIFSYTNNRLISTTGPVTAKNDLYDNAGNLNSDGNIAYTFNARGRMASAKKGTNAVVNYLYNGLGQRVSKVSSTAIVSTGTNYYSYDEQGHLLGEYDANKNILQETVFLGDIPVAVLKQETSNGVTNITPYYVFADHINTPRIITRSSDNQIIWRWVNSDPFGMGAPNENPNGLGGFTYNPRFPGQLLDKETGLHYNYFRDYDPQTGRYVESDPIGLKGGVNTYSYVEGNPVINIDPNGLAILVKDTSSFQAMTAWNKKYKALIDANNRMREIIKRYCPQLLPKFDDWKVYPDPKIDDTLKKSRGDYADTKYSTQSTQFNHRFFEVDYNDPSEISIFAHEFRHLMKENADLYRPGDEMRDPATVPGEIDADNWAKNLFNGKCICQ